MFTVTLDGDVLTGDDIELVEAIDETGEPVANYWEAPAFRVITVKGVYLIERSDIDQETYEKLLQCIDCM